jgi:hypothetical protein
MTTADIIARIRAMAIDAGELADVLDRLAIKKRGHAELHGLCQRLATTCHELSNVRTDAPL